MGALVFDDDLAKQLESVYRTRDTPAAGYRGCTLVFRRNRFAGS